MAMTAEKARQILSNVPGHQAFWLSDGHGLMNLKELRNALTTMPMDVFNHHVNDQRNDFANWIRDIVKDSDLAAELQRTKTIHLTLLKVNARVRELESLVMPKVTKISLSPIRVNVSSRPKKAAKKKASKPKPKKKRR